MNKSLYLIAKKNAKLYVLLTSNNIYLQLNDIYGATANKIDLTQFN